MDSVVLLIGLIAGAIVLSGCTGPVACTADARLCSDGSYVGRVGPDCEFDECPALEYCNAETACSQGKTCYLFQGEQRPYCFAGDPCSKCPSSQCNVLESYPAQVRCTEEQECRGEGETIPVIANPPGCCPGLELIPPKEENWVGIAGYCTANCGNGTCDAIETGHNCPADCRGNFCGSSTMSACQNDSDCVEDGCSGQICRSKNDERVITTCEYLECYNNGEYGLECQCTYGTCQWSPTTIEAQARQFCGRENIAGIYVCGNYIKTVSSLLGGGSTYVAYSDLGQLGDSIECPVVGPDSMTEECRQLMELECVEQQVC